MTNLNLKNPTKELIEQYLQEKGFETKDDSGQIRTNKCPFCHDSKIDWTHFYISHSGLYFCHKCGSQGNLTALVKHFGDFEMTPQKGKNLNEPIKSPQIIMPQKKKELTDPNTEELKKYSESAEEYHKNLFDKKNKTAEKILEYLNTDRGLEKYTLEFFKIGWTGSSISIPIVEEGKVVNIRFRKSPFDTNDKIPKMLNSKGGKMTLFNADILKTANKVVVTEGEIDAMTLWQRGWAEVVSITCGANTFKEEWVELFKTQKSIYLCYDNDEVGKKGIEVAVEKLGAGKCYQVLLPKQLQETKKDLNEFFVKDKKSIDDFYNLYNSAKKINIDYEHIKHIKDLTVETKNLLLGSDTLRGLSTGYPSVDKLWAGMRKGDLIILSGDTNVGKTFFAQNIILNLARSGVNSMLFSLEQPVEEIVERFMLLDSELNFQQDKEKDEKTAIKNLDLACSKLASVPIYLYSGYDRIEPKLLGEISSKAVKDFGCEIVFIDHLHYFATGDRRQRTVEIGDMVRYVKLLARKLQIPIVLIAHIKYLEHGGKVPTMDDLKDSSAIKQDADIVALLYRERDKNTRELESSSILNTDKNRHGKMGQLHFTFGDDKEHNDAQGNVIESIPIGQFRESSVGSKNNPNSPKAQFDKANQTVTQQYTNLQDKSLQNVPPVTKTNIPSVQKHPDEIAEEKDLKASREESKDIKVDDIEKQPF